MTTSVTEPQLGDVPLETWNGLAEMANAMAEENGESVTGEQIRDDYARITEESFARPDQELIIGLPSPQTLPDGDIAVGPYELQIPRVPAVTIAVEGTYHPGGQDDWCLKGTAKLKVAGKVVWTTQYNFSAREQSMTWHPDVFITKADITLGVFGSNHCLRIFGKGCYRHTPMSSWTCAEFDETLLCFAQYETAVQTAVDPFADFSGTCGENSAATSENGLKVNQQVRIGEESDLSSCVAGNNESCVYSIRLVANSGIYKYSLQVDGQGPRNLLGSYYLAFKDDTGAVYNLKLTSSARSTHTIKFNTSKPTIRSFKWSNKAIPNW